MSEPDPSSPSSSTQPNTLSQFHIISGSNDRTIKIWDPLRPKDPIRVLTGHTASIRSFCIHPSGKYIVSASSDTTIKIYLRESGRLLKTLSGHSHIVRAIAITDHFIVSGSDDSTIKIWAFPFGNCLRTCVGHHSTVNHISISSDCSKIISSSDDESIIVI